MSLLGLILLMALVLGVLALLIFMSRTVRALEHIEQLLQRLVAQAYPEEDEAPGPHRGR